MIVVGISCYYHDAAVCILKDGHIVAAAAEERFTRIKHDNNFPIHALQFCLDWVGISVQEVDVVVFYEKPIIKFERILHQHLAHFPKSRKVFMDTIGSWFDLKLQIPKTLKKTVGYTGPVKYIEHHLSHAASSYYISPFNTSVIVTLDGVGEWATTTVGFGRGNNIRIDREIHFPHSLGLLYSALTYYLGFGVNDAEYKVMGLAAYGDPGQFRKEMNELVTSFHDGSYTINQKYFDYAWADRMTNKRLEELFDVPRRVPESPMKPSYENIAASLQEKLEEVVIALLNATYSQYNCPNLCLAGGVALNSVLNGKILSRTKFKKLYIPPDPGDGGGAMGAALLHWYSYNKKQTKKSDIQFSPSLGPSYSSEHIQSALDIHNLSYIYIEDKEEYVKTIAKLLSKQKIIGWFQGRMEWGPRALGNRSILASAVKSEMKDIINSKVKHRELFRPFAPAVLDKHVHRYFKTDRNVSPSIRYMLMVYPFTSRGRKEAPATVHVDGSGRLQVIERDDNPLYYDLVEQYGELTGSPILVNTSFNVRGEPIVCTPYDAIQCFLRTDIDYLAIGNFLVKK